LGINFTPTTTLNVCVKVIATRSNQIGSHKIHEELLQKYLYNEMKKRK
jgi:hypothetical protein